MHLVNCRYVVAMRVSMNVSQILLLHMYACVYRCVCSKFCVYRWSVPNSAFTYVCMCVSMCVLQILSVSMKCPKFCFYTCMHVCIDVCAPNSVCRCVCSKLQQLNTLLLAYHLFDYSSLIVEAWLRRDWAWRSWKRITSKPTRRRLCPNWWSSWTRCRWYLSSDCIYRSDGIYRSGGIWYRSMVSIYRAWNHGIVVMPCMHASERELPWTSSVWSIDTFNIPSLSTNVVDMHYSWTNVVCFATLNRLTFLNFQIDFESTRLTLLTSIASSQYSTIAMVSRIVISTHDHVHVHGHG